MTPITVLMPVYNCERYVGRAVESILSQTYSDFEFIIINDGSTDNTKEILEKFKDPRIRLVLTENRGLASSLRYGVEIAKGEYIARMDADDESLPWRLEIEKKYLDNDPKVVVVHGMYDLIDEKGSVITKKCGGAYSNSILKWLLLWSNIINHPTVMIRTKSLRDNNLNYLLGMDEVVEFDLWNKLSSVGDFQFIPRVVLKYRIHKKSFTQLISENKQLPVYADVILENFKRYDITITREIAEELAVISGGTMVNPLTYTYRDLPKCLLPLFEDLSRKFLNKSSISEKELSQIQARQLFRWARSLLQSSKKASFNLLKKAFRLHGRIAFSRIFLLTSLMLFLPIKMVIRINKKRTRSLI